MRMHNFKLCEGVQQIVCRQLRGTLQWRPTTGGSITMSNHAYRLGRTEAPLRHTGVLAALAKTLFAIAALAAVMPEFAIADSGHPPSSERLSATVSLSDLNLATPEGMRSARARLARQALTLCRKFSDSRRISDRETVADCVRDAVAEALARLPHSTA
jgi:UrcA family protein